MAGKTADLQTLRDAIDGMHRHSVEVRMMAVAAELEEQAKPKRDASQDEIARRYGATGRMLRYWVEWYSDYGLAGLEDQGGQGAKPLVPREVSWGIIDECVREESEPPNGGGDGGGGEPCEACKLAKEGKKPARDPPKPCPCRGRCATRGKRGGGCTCAKGRVCKCKCCRPIRLRPKGPRHSPDCPNRRVGPRNGTTAKRVRDAIEEKTGTRYSDPQTRRIMKERPLTRRRLTRQQTNRADPDKKARWQARLKISIKKYEEEGWEIYIHDEVHVVDGKKNGVVWGPKGERSTLPRSGSGQRLTLHGSVSLKGKTVLGEYVRGDSATLVDHVEEVMQTGDKILILTDNHASHASEDTKRALRRLRRKYPEKKIRIRRLPVGCPDLSIVEELWNWLKDALLARVHYPEFNELRWDIQDFAEDHKTIHLDAKKYLFRKD